MTAVGARLQVGWKNFHFNERKWVLSFPSEGNEGRKYLYYKVKKTDLESFTESFVSLFEVFDSPEFDANYPYTVGFFKQPINGTQDLKPFYLEIRVIASIEDFWKFLNDLDI